MKLDLLETHNTRKNSEKRLVKIVSSYYCLYDSVFAKLCFALHQILKINNLL